jgi:8-oxo-dGTP diphosphatase
MIPQETKYVVGFMFDESMTNVALIRKNKPAWQTGLLNGIGGKVEADEDAFSAMVREFREEAGCDLIQPWVNFCSMSGTNNDGGSFAVECFYVKGEPHKLTALESEQIELVSSADVAAGKAKTIGNLPWLVALALDFGKGAHPPSKVTALYL